MNTPTIYTLSGPHAERIAARDGLTLTDGEARVIHVGWTADAYQYDVTDYFRGGEYLGPDCHGVEPLFALAPAISPETEASTVADWTKLLTSLIPDIGDDYRCSDDPDDDTPGILVTFGVTVGDDGTLSWGYQTGDNSYSGGAYGHPVWGIAYLYRDSDCTALAQGAMNECLGQLAQ